MEPIENTYSGLENLEIMSEAIKYNKHLINLIMVGTKPGDTIMDFGAGLGSFAKIMANKGHAVLCLEPDAHQIVTLKQNGLSAVRSLDEVPDNSIDYIYSLNVLEHIEDDQSTLASLHKKLKSKGKFLIYVPAFMFLFSKMDEKVGHVRRYTRDSLCKKVLNAGFHVKSSRYCDSLGFLATLAYKYIDRSDGTINKRSLILYDRLIFPLSIMIDKLTHMHFGKNVYAICVKP